MQTEQPIFAQTVIRIDSPMTAKRRGRIFKIYGVRQPLHVQDPCRIIPRNDNLDQKIYK